MKVSPKTVTLKNGQEILLRSPAPEEAAGFLNHLVTTHTESYQNLDRNAESWKKMPVETETKIIEDFEKSASRFFLVAVLQGQIVGGMGVVGEEKDFRKHNATLGMSIQNSFSGVGLGTEMMKYSLEQAKKLEFHRLELTVRTYNTSAIALYEKVGFQKIGLLKECAFVEGRFVDEYAYQLIL